MAVPAPSTIAVTGTGALLSPLFDAPPLESALKNGNYAYLRHRPALAQVVYTDAMASGTHTIQIPILPSADGLLYAFDHHVRTGAAGTSNINVTVEQYAGGWTTIYGPTGTAAGASAVVRIQHTATVSASATLLRLTYARATGTEELLPDSLLVYPAPASVTTGTTLGSGFLCYDDGLLTASGAPLNTELLNRGLRNVRKIRTDRAQCVLSFAQQDSIGSVVYDMSSVDQPVGQFGVIGRAVAHLPYAERGTRVEVRILGTTGGGGGTGQVRVTEAPIGDSVTLDLDGAVNSATLTLQLQDPGTIEARADLVILAAVPTGGATRIAVNAVMGWVSPDDTSASPVTSEPAPSASTLLLGQSLRMVEDELFRPWAQPALCYDGMTTGRTTRRFAMAVPPGIHHARAWVTRCGTSAPAVAIQAATVIRSTTSGGFGGPPFDITVPSQVVGTVGYLDTGTSQQVAVVYRSGDTLDDSPSATVDRLIEMPEAAASAVEVVEVVYTAGCGIHTLGQTAVADRTSI